MSSETRIGQRLLAVEDAIADLRRQLPSSTTIPAVNWLDQVIGSLKDEPAFDEVLALGREYRIADRALAVEGL